MLSCKIVMKNPEKKQVKGENFRESTEYAYLIKNKMYEETFSI